MNIETKIQENPVEIVAGVQRKYLTKPEAAKYLGVSQRSIDRWMKTGVLKYVKLARTVRFRIEDL